MNFRLWLDIFVVNSLDSQNKILLKPTIESNRELLQKIILHDDQRAYLELFHRFYPRLMNFTRYYIQSYQEAEDVVAEVFYKLLKNKRQSLEIQNVEAYFFVATKHEALKALKKGKRLQIQENTEDYHFHVEPSSEKHYLDAEFNSIVSQAINAFPPKRKVIFKLAKEEGMKYKEIAKLLDLSVKTVETHMMIALKTLRGEISDYTSCKDTKMRQLKPPLAILFLISILLT